MATTAYMPAFSYDDLERGRVIEEEVFITRRMVADFGDLVGDHNPLHEGRHAIAHGALIVGLVSGLVSRSFRGAPVVRKLYAKFLDRVPAASSLRIILRVRRRLTFPGVKRGFVFVEVECFAGERTATKGRVLILVPRKPPSA